VALGTLPILPYAARSLRSTAAAHVQSDPLTFWRSLQTVFSGEPVRYGFILAHRIFPWIALALALACLLLAIRRRDRRLVYLLAQAGLPMAAFFIVSPLVGIRMPVLEAKQFIVLWPAYAGVLAGGLAAIHAWLATKGRPGTAWPALPAAGILVLLLAFNARSLYRYWTTPKAADALAVQSIVHQVEPGDRVVSLHYTATYALAFYGGQTPVYFDPSSKGGQYTYKFAQAEAALDRGVTPPRLTIEEVRAGGRFWVAVHALAYREPLDALIAGCTIEQHEVFRARHMAMETLLVECPETTAGQ
jgi:hypothetical protein